MEFVRFMGIFLLAGLSAAGPAGAAAPRTMDPQALGQELLRLAARPDARRVVLRFEGPVATRDRSALEAAGVRLLDYVGDHTYFASLTDRLAPSAASAVPGVLDVTAVDPRTKLHPDLARGRVHPWAVVAEETPEAPPTVAAYVLFHRDVDLAREAASILAKVGGTVSSTIESVNGVVAHLRADRFETLAGLDPVLWVEPPLPTLEPFNDSNRVRVGANAVTFAPYGMTGSGVSVMVYDGGSVLTHGDLAGRLTSGDSTGVSDHATHVACTVAGDGAGGSQYRGVAPDAEVVSYGFQGGSGFLYTDPGDMEDDYTEAFLVHGADLSNNSIGSNVALNGLPCEWEGNYGATGAMIDSLVAGALGMPIRIVWAGGNERGYTNCGQSYESTPPPACAKNSMVVGAINSNDDSVTSFTSWGPCDDGRVKPEVVAPGCQSDDDDGVSSCSSSGGYTTKCGTSMASPTAAGVAALLLQKYRDLYPERPDFRNSTLRAVLAHTAVDLGNPGPDYQTGYGSIRVQPAADVLIGEQFLERAISQGQIFAFDVEVGPGDDEVRVTLVWDDPPAVPLADPVLVNDLDLRVIAPGGGVHHPWTLDPSDPSAPAVQTVRDGLNNIEQVRITGVAPGTYTVQIEAVNIAEGDEQIYSVVATPDLSLCAAEPTFAGLASAQPGASCGEVDLSWPAGSSNCSFGTLTYDLYRSTTPGFTPSPANRVAAGLGGTGLTDTALEPGQQYHYLVRAVDSAGVEDQNAVEVSVTSPVDPDVKAPVFAGLASAAASGTDCGQVALVWDNAVETCSLPVRYEIHRSSDPGFVPDAASLVGVTFGTGFIDTSVDLDEPFTYLVRAVDATGNQEANDTRQAALAPALDSVFFESSFEPDDAGWTLGSPNDADTGTWEWGDPIGTSYQPGDDASDPGMNCWITGIATTPSNGDIDGGTTTLLSQIYDMSGATAPGVHYRRWFTNDQGNSPGDPTDTFRIDVSNDGGDNWTSLEEIGEGTPLAWVEVAPSLPLAPTSQMRFRFTAADLEEGSVVEAAIDDFRLVDEGQACLGCAPVPSTLCTISVNRSGDDVLLDWSQNPVGSRAVIYDVASCDERVKLGTADGNEFLHESAAISPDLFRYRVTFVDECGQEVGFCGATDCP